MNKLSRTIEELDEADLLRAKKDLTDGALLKLIDTKLSERREEDWNKVCPVCHTPIEDNAMTLIFGPRDMRKKASFCALDCLEYFIERLKEQKRPSRQRKTTEEGM